MVKPFVLIARACSSVSSVARFTNHASTVAYPRSANFSKRQSLLDYINLAKITILALIKTEHISIVTCKILVHGELKMLHCLHNLFTYHVLNSHNLRFLIILTAAESCHYLLSTNAGKRCSTACISVDG